MAIVTIEALKGYFNDGDVPSESDYIDLIDTLGGGGLIEDVLRADGSIPLTADWDAGPHKIIAEQFESDVAVGTAPFIVASTTIVDNFNADRVDGYDAADFLIAANPATIIGLFTFDRDPAAPFAVSASSAVVTNLDADKLDGYEASAFPRKAEAATITGAWTFSTAISGDLPLDGDLDFTGAQSITTTADNLTLAPAGDLVLNPGGNDVLPGTTYDINIGSITSKYLSLHVAELWASTLVAEDVMATIGGRILVGHTTRLTNNLTSIATIIYVEHNNLASGDYIMLEANSAYERMLVTSAPSGTGPYSYSVTRNQDGSGPNTWQAGDAVFNMGASGDGWIDLYSQRGVESGGYGPAIVGNIVGASGSWVEGWAIGNLNGLYGYISDIYGAAFGKYSEGPYLTIDPTNGVRFLDAADAIQAQLSGSIRTIGRVASGYSSVQIASGSIRLRTNDVDHMVLNTAGTFWAGDAYNAERIQWDTSSGLRIFNASNQCVIQMDTSGNAYFTQKIKVSGTTGAIALGVTPPTSASAGTGVWIDRTGIFGLASSVQQFYLDATTGVAYAGGGAIQIGEDGILIDCDHVDVWEAASAITWYGSGGVTDVACEIYGHHYINISSFCIDVYPLALTHATFTIKVLSPTTSAYSIATMMAGVSGGASSTFSVRGPYGANSARAELTSMLLVNKGLFVGDDNTEPADGTIQIYKASGDPLLIFDIAGTDRWTVGVDDSDSDKFKINSGGSLATTSILMLTSTGTLELSSAAADPQITLDIAGTNSWTIGVDNSDLDKFKINSGGSLANPSLFEFSSAGDFEYQGKLISYKNSTTYAVWGFRPLTTPLTSTAWDGDARSTTAKTKIVLNTIFGVPAGVKAVLLYATFRDSNSVGTGTFAIFSPVNTANVGPMLVTGDSGVNDRFQYKCEMVPCDANGDIYYQLIASGTLTMDLWVQIWGYWI